MKKVFLHSLGCPKNLVDSEKILGRIEARGHMVCDFAQGCDAAIVNTCCFIKEATEESAQAVAELSELKKAGGIKTLIIAGCMAGRFRDRVKDMFPEADFCIPPWETEKIADLIDERPGAGEQEGARHRITQPHYAYVKISDGCDNHCSYCVIGRARGEYRSVKIDAILKEVSRLVDSGVKEINIVSQDSGMYGKDTGFRAGLAGLLERILKTANPCWVRLLYLHPAHITDDVIDMVAGDDRICSYLDIPIQHINDRILAAMNRHTTKEQTIGLIRKVRKLIPGVTIRTSVIAGFPGETQPEFEELLSFVKEARFERLGAFTYSREEGTPSAAMRDQVPENIKERRFREIMRVQQEISRENNARVMGRRLKVLVDEPSNGNGYAAARSEADAPEVDGNVLVRSARASQGAFLNVKITGAREYDLIGVEI